MTDLQLTTRLERAGDEDQIERLHDRAFGPGRYARTAYRLREGRPHRTDLSFTALVGTLLVGSVRLSSVRAGDVPALISQSLEAARKAGEKLVLLVGDEPYYRRFGFRVVPDGQLVLPGPVDPARFLYAELVDGALAAAHGEVHPAS